MASRRRYDSNLYSTEPLHYAACEGNAELVQELVTKRANIYKPINNGETALHVALYHEKRDVCDVLLRAYENDFRSVDEYFQRKFEGIGNERFWLKKLIPVACSESQCERALELEQNNGLTEHKNGEFEVILLKNTTVDKHVVALQITEDNRSQIDEFIQSLKTNGYLSWEYRGFRNDNDTLLQLAVLRGDIEIIVRLIHNGANLAQPGRDGVIPLMEACIAKNMAVVKLLMEEYGDRFDPTVSNRYGETVLSYMLRTADAANFDYVLHKLMEYRKKAHNETDNQAFNNVFKAEHPYFPQANIWCVDGSKRDFVEQYLYRYDYDLSYRAGDRIMLMEVIINHTAKTYYQSQIRQKPELLELTHQDDCNVLHCLLWSNELDFVRELYDLRPEQCRDLFQRNSGAVMCIVCILTNEHKDVLRFLLETHLEYIENIANNVMDSLFEEDFLPESIFDEILDIWISFLPQMKQRVDELHYKIAEENMREDEDPGLTYRLCGGLD